MNIFNKAVVYPAIVAVAMGTPTAPAWGDNKLKKILLGIGAAAILNEAAKGSSKKKSGGGKKSSSGSGVKSQTAQIQSALNSLGFNAGPVDGQSGARTIEAIKAFQASRDYNVTGKLSPTEFAALRTNSALAKNPQAANATLPKAAVYETQLYLSQLGFNVGRPDGVWGPKSQAALDSFRQNSGLASGSTVSISDLNVLHQQVHGSAMTLASNNGLLAGASAGLLAGSGAVLDGNGQLATGNGALLGSNGQLATGNGALLGSNGQLATGNGALLRGNGQLATGNGALLNGNSGLSGTTNASLDGNGNVLLAGATIATTQEEGTNNPLLSSDGATTSSSEIARPKLSPGEYVQIDMNRGATPGFSRAIALQVLKANPAILDDVGVLQNWFSKDYPRQGATEVVRIRYDNGNQIVKEDMLRTFRAQLLDEADTVAEISGNNVLGVVIAQRTRFGSYVDGGGLGIQSQDSFNWSFNTGFLPGVINASAEIPDTSSLAISRQQAIALIDQVKANRQTLSKVVWGHFTRIGKDERLAAFARDDLQRGVVPTTFHVDRVTLNVIDQGEQGNGKPLYEWKLKNPEQESQGGQSAFEYLKSVGAPIFENFVLAQHSQAIRHSGKFEQIVPGARGASTQAWQRLLYLTWLQQNPNFASEGNNFILVANQLMNEAEKRQFFGPGARNLHHLQNVWSAQQLQNNGVSIFKDEFAAQDAKAVFLSKIYPNILSQVPKWPLRIAHVVKGSLGTYNFENEYFPLTIHFDESTAGQIRVAKIGAGNRNTNYALASADRLGNLPKRLNVSQQQARSLREIMKGSTDIYFAWFSELDMTQDGTNLEQTLALGQAKTLSIKPGRAKLLRAAFFIDPALRQPLLELDPAAIALDPSSATQSTEDGETLASITPVDDTTLLKNAITMIGDPALKEAVIRSHKNVKTANEFDADNAAELVRSVWDAHPDRSIWFPGQASLGRYDRENGLFPFNVNRNRLQFNVTSDFGYRVTSDLRGANIFQPLEIEEDLARKIVEMEARQVKYFVRAEPRIAKRQANYAEGLNLILEPVEVVFFIPQLGLEDQIVGRRNLVPNGSYFEQEFSDKDFAALKDGLQPMTRHAVDLLLVKRLDAATLDENIDNLMLATLAMERQGATGPGQPFFANAAIVDATELELLRPRFRSWITAKASALGSRFTLTNTPQYNSGRCDQPSLMTGQYRDPSTVSVVDVASVSSELASLIEARRTRTDPFTFSRDHVAFMGQISSLHGGCDAERWLGVVQLNGIGATPMQSNGQPYDMRQTDVMITRIRTASGVGNLPDILIEADVYETREFEGYLPGTAQQGTLRAKIENPDRDDMSLMSASVTLDESREQQGDASLSQSEGDFGQWPDAVQIEITKSELDMVGLRVGDTAAHADFVLNDAFEISAVFHTNAPVESAHPALKYQKVYVIDGGTQLLTTMSYTSDGPILAIARHLYRSGSPWPKSAVIGGLSGKYGDPKFVSENSEVLLWAEKSDCTPLKLNSLGVTQLAPLDSVKVTPEQDELIASALSANAVITRDSVSGLENCGSVIHYSSEPLSKVEGYHSFHTVLIDTHALTATLDAMAPKTEEPSVEIKF